MAKSVRIGSSKVTLDVTPILKIERELGRHFKVRVGLLGSDGSKEHPDSKGQSNADVGLVHEKGSKSRKIPRRSFLEMPLSSKQMTKVMQTVGQGLMENASKDNIVETYTKLGVAAEGVVQKAFRSGGFGTWKPLKPRTIAAKGSSRILVDTSELRRSIHSAVVESK